MEKRFYINCEKCKRRLIERKPNGIWRFKFGFQRTPEGDIIKFDPVINMHIHGSIKMKCFRKDCRHVNILNHVPFREDFEKEPSQDGS